MEKLLKDILASMEKERDLYTELVELSTRKTDIIIKKKVDVLDKLVDLEQELITHIVDLESERQGLVERLSIEKNVDPESITLSSLIKWSDGDIRIRFESLKEEFDRIIDRQRHLNEVNSKLIKTNLEYIDFALNLMTGDGASGSIYEKKGKVSKGGQSRNLFDTKA
ncbi:MAG: flagellar protein FlgN [Clostridiales bacterium]|nr:flagellar protein FlgN [Clostridiales bacterium]